MSGHEYWSGLHFWWIFPLVMMVFCFWFMRGCGRRMWWPGGSFRSWRESPMDILNRRYASGEIDQQEYDEKKRVLES